MKWTGWLVLFIGLSAWASPPLVLVEPKVAQYRMAADAAKKHLPGAVELDPSAAGVAERLASASVILAVGQKSFQMAREKAPGVPTLFCMVLGVKPSLLGPNVSGVPLESDPQVLLSHVKALYPAAKKVGVLYNPESSELLLSEAQRAAPGLGLTLVPRPVKEAGGVREAATGMSEGVQVIWLPPDPRLFSRELFSFLLGFSAERKIPLIGFLESFTQAGALASVSADYLDIGDRAGKLTADALARGSVARPPVGVVFSPGVLTVNLKTARALGVDVPPKAIAGAKLVFR